MDHFKGFPLGSKILVGGLVANDCSNEEVLDESCDAGGVGVVEEVIDRQQRTAAIRVC